MMEKTRQYYDTIQEAKTMLFRIAFHDYYKVMPNVEVIQEYEGRLLRLNINEVMFEVKENHAEREVEAMFGHLLNSDTSDWLSPDTSIMYNGRAIRQRLIDEGYTERKTVFYLDQVYKVQCTIMERIEFVRRMIDYLKNRYNEKDIPFDTVLSPSFDAIDEEGLKALFKPSFMGKGMNANYWSLYIPSLRKNWSDIDYARIASLTYNSKYMNRKPNIFKTFYEQFCRLVGCQYHKDYKPSKLKPNGEIEKEFSYLLR